MNKTFAIIGSKGYLGRHIKHYLNQLNIEPQCYDITESDEPNYNKINLEDKISISKINLDVDYIFFFSGITGTNKGFDEYNDFVIINEIGLLNFLDYIRHSPFRPKIVYPSSRLVYKGYDHALKETDEKEAKTIYAANKLASENFLKMYKNYFDIPYTIFRLCIPYGNLLDNDYSFGTIGFFIKMASSGRNITLYGDGILKRTFTYIEDVCLQFVQGAMLDKSNNEIYNIGGETLSLYDAANIIAGKYHVKVESVPWPKNDLKIESGHTYFDDTKIKELLNITSYKHIVDFKNLL